MKNGIVTEKMEDQHILIEDLLENLRKVEEPILFIGTDVALYEEMIKEMLEERAVIAPVQFNLPRASSLIYVAEQMETKEEVHHFVPEYRRIAEAEANWLKAQRDK